MPIHDWSRVEAGIFHDFHHAWIEEIKRALNGGILSGEYYALAEQHTSRYGPDVLTLQGPSDNGDSVASSSDDGGVLVAAPKLQVTAEGEIDYYRRKQNAIAIRHVSGDRIVAMVEIVSPGNKSSQSALRAFVEKASELLQNRIQLLVIDLHVPTPRDPHGVHGAIWEETCGQSYTAPKDKPLTQASYEVDLSVRAYVVPIAVGDMLTEMPLFLKFGVHVVLPLEATYQAAWQAVPRRWRNVLEHPA